MTHGALRVSAIALGAAAFVSLSPLSAASAATSTGPADGRSASRAHLCASLCPPRLYAHYVWRNGRRYVWNGHSYVYGYGYNPGAAAAAGVIGGIAGCGAAGYPYGCDPYGIRLLPRLRWATTTGRIGAAIRPYYGGFGYGYGPGFYGHGCYGQAATVTAMPAVMASTAEAPISPAETSATWAASAGGGFGGHMGGFGGGHFGGFGGGHMGGFGGGAHMR